MKNILQVTASAVAIYMLYKKFLKPSEVEVVSKTAVVTGVRG